MCLTMGACYLHFRRSVCGTIVVKFAGFGKPVGFRGPAGFGAGGRSSPVTGFGSGSGSVVGSRVRVHGLSTRPEPDPLPSLLLCLEKKNAPIYNFCYMNLKRTCTVELGVWASKSRSQQNGIKISTTLANKLID
jgi:hypothetical protein